MLRLLLPRKSRVPTVNRFAPMTTPFDDDFHELMERLFDENDGWVTPGIEFVPSVDLVETDKTFEVTVDLPGLQPEEVNVELNDGDLWITGTREEKKEEKDKTYHRVERRHGEFRRVLPLPSAIDESEIDARFDRGVLKITVAKSEEFKPRRIEVRS